jgi:two-component system CheB/CheR fusion protein
MFPVVAVGASAGGLEALTQLLGALPKDTGMAFLILQHHDPKHESALHELLERATAMPVRDAATGTRLEPNHVYVVSSNAELVGDTFDVSTKSVSTRMPIDVLFRSVAEQFKTRAIGVVLSGTLSDGALGLRAIKAEDGITFAQSEESAKFADMPRAAIAAGSVDVVASPKGIAQELARMGTHPYIRPVKTAPEALVEGDGHQRVLALLKNAKGIDFSNYRQSTIKRRISRRMAVRRTENLDAYVEILREEPAELHALYEDLLITVTGFFRDREVFTALNQIVMPKLLRDRAVGDPLRIWVPGCSTGEEVYSIAMLLFEMLQETEVFPPVQIFATDVSEAAIEKARSGIYLENAMVDVSPERRRRFFVQVEGGYQVTKRIRDVCIFARQNVAADPPFSNLDLISCRNMLIYLDEVLQKRVIPFFHYALKPSGFLVLGSSESIGGFADLFTPVDRRNRIFVKRPTLTRPVVDFGAYGEGARAFHERPPAPRAGANDVTREADRLVLGRYGPPGVLINDQFEAIHFRGKTGPYLETAPGAASFNVLKMAREGMLVELRAAVVKAKKSGRPVRQPGVRVRQDGTFRETTLEVIPIPQGQNGNFFLVLFEADEHKTQQPRPADVASRRRPPAGNHEVVARLEQELTATKDYLQSIIEEEEASNEELKSANEEILSSNEELQSTNEELETAKEELQSANEELTTVNEELQNRNAEIAHINDDLINLLAATQIAILVLGPEGRIRRFTPEAEKLFNLVPTDVGRMIGDIKGKVDVSDLPAIVQEVVETGQPREREVQDSSGKWYQMRVRPYRTADNRVDGAVVAFVDIDPLKRSLEQVSRARTYSEVLVETVRDALAVLDGELRIRTANQAFYRTFRTSPLQADGKRLTDLFDLDRQLPDLVHRLKEALDGREAMSDMEIEFNSDERDRRVMCLTGRRVRLPAEASPFLVLSLEDITQRRRDEQRLIQSETRYRRLFETAREGIWVLNGDTGEILDVNSYLLDRLGYAREDLIGRKPWLTGLFEQPEQARADFRDVRRKGFSFDPQVVLRSKSGVLVHFESIANSIESDSTRIIQYNLRDITERARLEDQVRQMQKLESVGTLAGGIAHDFNNLLNIISAHLALLPREKDEAGRSQHRDAIDQAVKRASGVVKQLLTFARKTEVSIGDVDLNAVLREIAEMLRETLPRSITIKLELDEDLSAIRGDVNQLHQALLNLSVNARDAMENGGQLTLRSESVRGSFLQETHPSATAEGYVCVTVADTGAGMDDETRNRIFEPFFTTKKGKGGQGLGLAVVYGVVNGHRGWIDIDSEVGRGTSFRLYFPVPDKEIEGKVALETQKALETAGRPATSAAGMVTGKILLIEDEELLRRPIRSLLEADGFQVLTASDGVEAVEKYRRHHRDIAAVILDLGLPKLDGWQTFLRMKEQDPKIKCIVASGNLDSQERQRLRDAGVVATLRKPYSGDEVVTALRNALASD